VITVQIAAAGAKAVETVGAYAGLAAVFGLGVLSLLYFAQAREVKRLREWAGRAPERATELEQRVQVDAQRRVIAQPMAPATVAAQNDAARQAAAAAELYAKLPPPPPPPAPLVGPPGQLARPAVPAATVTATPAAGGATGNAADAPVESKPATPAPALPAAAAAPAAFASSGNLTATPSPAAAAAATATAAAAARGSSAAPSTVSPTTNGAGQDTHESDAARPAPLPLPPAASADDDDGGFSGARIGAIVGAAVFAVLVAVVLMVSLTGDDPKPKPNDFGTITGAVAAPDSSLGTSSTPSELGSIPRVARKSVKVAVLNGTSQTGLAREVADKLGASGFTIPTVGNNDQQQVPQTIVSYTAGNERAAQTVAGLIKVDRSSVQALDANASVAADADVVVTVGTDQIG
jgi:hypothetical protein